MIIAAIKELEARKTNPALWRERTFSHLFPIRHSTTPAKHKCYRTVSAQSDPPCLHPPTTTLQNRLHKPFFSLPCTACSVAAAPTTTMTHTRSNAVAKDSPPSNIPGLPTVRLCRVIGLLILALSVWYFLSKKKKNVYAYININQSLHCHVIRSRL